MAALGLLLATVLWLGWDGGRVGEYIAGWLHDFLGTAVHVLPVVLVAVGGLMLVRSALVDVRPFRTGLAVGAVGLMIALGKDQGGIVGTGLGGGLAYLVGETGALIIGAALFLAGSLLITGASAGALLRRSGSVMRRAGASAAPAFSNRATRSRSATSVKSKCAWMSRRGTSIAAPDTARPGHAGSTKSNRGSGRTRKSP